MFISPQANRSNLEWHANVPPTGVSQGSRLGGEPDLPGPTERTLSLTVAVDLKTEYPKNRPPLHTALPEGLAWKVLYHAPKSWCLDERRKTDPGNPARASGRTPTVDGFINTGGNTGRFRLDRSIVSEWLWRSRRLPMLSVACARRTLPGRPLPVPPIQ